MSSTPSDPAGEPITRRATVEVADLVSAAAEDESFRLALSRAWSAGFAAGTSVEPLGCTDSAAALDPFRRDRRPASRSHQRPRVYSTAPALPDDGSITGMRIEQPVLGWTNPRLRVEQPVMEFTIPGMSVRPPYGE